MDERQSGPFWDQTGSLTAMVLLTYGLNQIIVLPSLSTEIPLLGILIQLEINTRFVMLSFAALLAAAGMTWVLRSHPNFQKDQSTLEHLILPSLSTLTLGVILTRLPLGPNLILAFAIAAFMLITVFQAEFIAHDPRDTRFIRAAFGLRLLAVVLVIGIVFATRSLTIRAVYSIPIIFVVTVGTTWRWLRLTFQTGSSHIYAISIGWIIAQISWALHYWPINPVKTALLLGIGTYVLTNLAVEHLREDLERKDLVEYGLILAGSILLLLLTP